MIATELASVCNIEMGQAPAGSSYNSVGVGLPLLAGAGDFGLDFPAASKFTSSPTKVSEPNDIIMCIRATIGDLNWSDRSYCLGRGVAGLRPKPKFLDRNYLWHWLSYARADLEKKARGSTFKQVSKKDIAELEIPLPKTLDEQRRIAAILDKANAIRRKREQAIALADDFVRSVFIEIFGDPLTNPKGFKKQKVALHLCTGRSGVQSGPFGAALKKHEYTTSGIPVWGVENVQINRFVDKARLFITEEKFQALNRYRVVNGDVLISRAGTVGRMCIAETTAQDSIISTNLTRVSLNPETLAPEFFVSLFTYVPERLGALKANNKDDAFTFLHPSTLKGTEIPIPDMDTQQRFVQILERHKVTKSIQEEHLAHANDLFSALTQRAFAGDL